MLAVARLIIGTSVYTRVIDTIVRTLLRERYMRILILQSKILCKIESKDQQSYAYELFLMYVQLRIYVHWVNM